MEIGTALGIAGIAVTVPALIDACVIYAYKLHDKIQAFKRATELFKEVFQEHKFYVKQMTSSLLFIKEVSSSIKEDLHELIRDVLVHLSKAFEISLDLIDRALDKDGNINKWWFMLHGKSALDKSLREVSRRHDIFLRCLHYSVLFGGSAVEQNIGEESFHDSLALNNAHKLREAVLQRLKNLPSSKMLLEKQDVPSGPRKLMHSLSTARVINPEKPGDSHYVIEYRNYSPNDIKSIRRIREIALILHSTDISMSILPCRGFYPDPISLVCELIFPLPRGMGNPRTLRDLLSSPENAQGVRHSLTARVKLATQLATAVLYVHTAQLVHKNICPETVVLLESLGDDPKLKFPTSLGTCFLMGFDFVRKEDEASSRTGDDKWEKNIYRHPERQGIHPEVDFSMLHDIYSLGVMLLEIAMWRSFVLLETDKNGGTKSVPNPHACRIVDKSTGKLKRPSEIQKIFVKKAEEYTPLVLGEKFQEVVLMCLTCLDGNFGGIPGVMDDDGMMVGLVFIQKILASLEEISL